MSNPTENSVLDLINQAEAELASIEHSPYSDAAFDTLKNKISRYIAQLITESIKVAKRHQADTVSSAHVERAAEYLVSDTSRKFFRHLGTFGGILLGAAISNILAMTSTNQYTTSNVVVTSILGIIGAFLVALHIATD